MYDVKQVNSIREIFPQTRGLEDEVTFYYSHGKLLGIIIHDSNLAGEFTLNTQILDEKRRKDLRVSDFYLEVPFYVLTTFGSDKVIDLVVPCNSDQFDEVFTYILI